MHPRRRPSPGCAATAGCRSAIRPIGRSWTAFSSHATCFVMPSLCEAAASATSRQARQACPSIGYGNRRRRRADRRRWLRRRSLRRRGACRGACSQLADGDKAQAAGSRARARADWFTWPKVAGRLLGRTRAPRRIGQADLRTSAHPHRMPGNRILHAGALLLCSLGLAQSGSANPDASGRDHPVCRARRSRYRRMHPCAPPCASFDRAYASARPGTRVKVAAGRYGTQSIQFRPRREVATCHLRASPRRCAA